MLVIFGCEKKPDPVKPLLDTYCYNCNREVTWCLYSVTEWLSLFFINTFRIKSEHYLVCEKCDDDIKIETKTYKQLNKLNKLSRKKRKTLHDDLVLRLEKHQLKDKNETQMKYIRDMKKDSFK